MSATIDMLRHYVDAGEIPCALIRVRKKGQVVLEESYGYADIEKEIPVDENTVFRLASMSKPVTAIAAMMMVEQGKLDLNTPICEYLPEFAQMQVADETIGFEEFYRADPNNPLMAQMIMDRVDHMTTHQAKRQILVKDLLNHSSGLGMGLVSAGATEAMADPADDLAARVHKYASAPLDFEPDTMTGYSAALGMEIMGRIIEIISGEDLNTFLQEHLMKPLGIDCLTFVLTEEQKVKRARLYEYQEGEPLIDVTDTAPEWKRVDPVNGYYSGAAGMYGSLKSYDRFAQMLANYGELDGVRVLKKETVEMIKEDLSGHHKFFMPGSRWGQGLVSFGAPEETGRPVSKGAIGWSGAYGTHFFVDHAAGISAVLMTQRSNIGGANSYVSMEAEKTIYQDIL